MILSQVILTLMICIQKFEKLFGKSRKPNKPILKFHKDLSASLQQGFEEVILEKLNYLYEKYNLNGLCLAGGCAFNSSLNGKIINNTKFDNIYFSPNVGDAGGLLGRHFISLNKKM